VIFWSFVRPAAREHDVGKSASKIHRTASPMKNPQQYREFSPTCAVQSHARSITISLRSRAVMAEMTSLESLQALHTDLVALTESRLSNLERLSIQLQAHIQDFKALLDRKFRNEQSRQKLATGTYDDLSVFQYTVRC
jgi:hypothetical protein